MWYLKSQSDDKIIYVVPQKKEITIGRSPDQLICDFAIQEDPSISRKHAVLIYLEDSLYVKDLGSRYGTFVNKSPNKIEININTKLLNNDIVKFGKMNSEWSVHEVKLITCTSTLKGENLQHLKQTLAKIGGLLKNDWDNTCEYLTMPVITLTIKVVLALVQGSYIVTTEFWNQCLKAINSNASLPDPKKYIPSVVELTLNKDVVCFLPDKKRSHLFSDQKFIFFSKRQFDMYENVLLKSSASPILLAESGFTKQMLCEDNVIVIQCNNSQDTEVERNEVNSICDYLKSKGKRLVADAEIGLAILYVSSAKYCNPDFNFPSEVVKQAPAQQSKVLAQETEEQMETSSKKENIVINESITLSMEGNSKRKLSEFNNEEMETHATKKLAKNVKETSNENIKRKFDHEATITGNPSKKMATGHKTEDDDLFNFITPSTSKVKSTDKLNLVKPNSKRKADFDNNEDDLFNFVENAKDNSENNVFDKDASSHVTKKIKSENVVEDISAMRGIKLDELKNTGINSNSIKQTKIKKELEDDDLDKKMNRLDIGSVVVTVRENLIIKRKPIEIEDNQERTQKNFKKFKKVWPVKMQVTIIPKLSKYTDASDDNTQNSTVY